MKKFKVGDVVITYAGFEAVILQITPQLAQIELKKHEEDKNVGERIFSGVPLSTLSYPKLLCQKIKNT